MTHPSYLAMIAAAFVGLAGGAAAAEPAIEIDTPMSPPAWALLERHRRVGSAQVLWLLIPVQIVWSNVQGLSALGPALIAAYALGASLQQQRVERSLFAALGGSVLASLVSPFGLEALLGVQALAGFLPVAVSHDTTVWVMTFLRALVTLGQGITAMLLARRADSARHVDRLPDVHAAAGRKRIRAGPFDHSAHPHGRCGGLDGNRVSLGKLHLPKLLVVGRTRQVVLLWPDVQVDVFVGSQARRRVQAGRGPALRQQRLDTGRSQRGQRLLDLLLVEGCPDRLEAIGLLQL